MKPSVRSSIGLGILYWLTQIAALLIVFPAFFIYGYVTKQPVDFEQAMPMLVTTMVSYVFLIAFLLYKGHLRTWSFYRWPGTYTIVLSLLALTGLIVVLDGLYSFLKFIPDIMKQEFDQLMSSGAGIAVICLFGPFIEELLFRGSIQKLLLKDHSPMKAILITALIFVVIHINPAQVVNAFFLGLLLGWLFYRTGSLWPSICAHILNNSLSVLLSKALPETENLKDVLSPWVYIFVFTASAILFIVCIYLIWATTRQAKNLPVQPQPTEAEEATLTPADTTAETTAHITEEKGREEDEEKVLTNETDK